MNLDFFLLQLTTVKYVYGFSNVNTRSMHQRLECHKLQRYGVFKCNLTSHSLSRLFIDFNDH
jgi:hypothetical protein